MRLMDKALVSLTMSMLASTAFGATITGTVTGPDGKPFMGAFVVAENAQNKMTVNVLSDQQGHYHVGNLPAATYTVKITAIGYSSDPRGRREAHRRPEGVVRLRAAEGEGELERSEHLSGPEAAPEDRGP